MIRRRPKYAVSKAFGLVMNSHRCWNSYRTLYRFHYSLYTFPSIAGKMLPHIKTKLDCSQFHMRILLPKPARKKILLQITRSDRTVFGVDASFSLSFASAIRKLNGYTFIIFSIYSDSLINIQAIYITKKFVIDVKSQYKT